VRAFLGLGSNVGDRLGTLRAARDALDGVRRVRVAAASCAYETSPQGPIPDQPDFLNACLEVETSLDPEELLEAVKALELRLGREVDPVPQGPRPIDIDLLLYGEGEYRSSRLVLPHPDILSRRFVLEPLLELDAELSLPDGTVLGARLEALRDQGVERLEAL
jgi:2-amino-4-hydroxy-6-hydroxymethyldihydropteridine diphosphokinase